MWATENRSASELATGVYPEPIMPTSTIRKGFS